MKLIALQHKSNPEISNAREREGTWCSLPVLILWMIKDRLDIFDNMRMAAVCRGWQLASLQYPKTLHSVGDGVPWILQQKYGAESKLREFISVPRKCKFVVDMPEFDGAIILCSKDGWILLVRMPRPDSSSQFAETPLMVNPLTRSMIELPELAGSIRYDAVFTTCDGYPRCVFLVIQKAMCGVTIKTAYPGDEVWTNHDFPPLGRKFSYLHCFLAIGQKVCCEDISTKHITVFDVANNTVKDFAPISRRGFLGEHNGKLIYVDHGVRCCVEGVYDFSSYAVYMYNEDGFWERLSNGAVADTSWYLRNSSTCITAKGKGLKVYHLRQKKSSFVDVHDLVDGSVETLPVPFQDRCYSCWIGIG